jgi:hypothetical protein
MIILTTFNDIIIELDRFSTLILLKNYACCVGILITITIPMINKKMIIIKHMS